MNTNPDLSIKKRDEYFLSYNELLDLVEFLTDHYFVDDFNSEDVQTKYELWQEDGSPSILNHGDIDLNKYKYR